MVMNIDLSLHMRKCLAYKDKWGSIFGEFKKIFDHISRMNQNENHCVMSLKDKISHHLPQFFSKIHYDLMLEFMGKRPMFTPLYIQNLMQDANNIRHPIRTPELTIDDISGSGISIKQVFCGYEDLLKVEDNWEFEKEVSSPNQIASLHTITSF